MSWLSTATLSARAVSRRPRSTDPRSLLRDAHHHDPDKDQERDHTDDHEGPEMSEQRPRSPREPHAIYLQEPSRPLLDEPRVAGGTALWGRTVRTHGSGPPPRPPLEARAPPAVIGLNSDRLY